ncbi:hypothetical protein V8G54_013326 [Vigna mungo]|uniref:AT3G52170-like helix-turn-helix domain-containing protein n=1 Tax=Vigna mungo TaxID=3915 RepID=A0AAQ3NUU3_VIGMU
MCDIEYLLVLGGLGSLHEVVAISFEVCYSVDPIKVHRHGWSHAATVPSEAPDAQKGPKRVPRHERRAMVEDFVNKYRAKNAGKFPTISDAQRQVGGNFYVVRDIMQELEYKSRTNSSNSVDEILVEKQFDDSKHPTTKSASVSSGNIEIAKYNAIQYGSQSVDLNDKETVNAGYEHHDGKRETRSSCGERRLFEEVEITSTSFHIFAMDRLDGFTCGWTGWMIDKWIALTVHPKASFDLDFDVIDRLGHGIVVSALTWVLLPCPCMGSNLLDHNWLGHGIVGLTSDGVLLAQCCLLTHNWGIGGSILIYSASTEVFVVSLTVFLATPWASLA